MGRVNGLSWSKNPFSESLILEIQNAEETTRRGSDLQLSPSSLLMRQPVDFKKRAHPGTGSLMKADHLHMLKHAG
jgi:hypothetical protein